MNVLVKHLDEKIVRRAAIKWLSRAGYNRNLDAKETHEHGVDIRVRHYKYARYFLVEVKGEPNSKTTKHPDVSREGAFLAVIGQLITRINFSALYWYALALPYTFESRIKRRIPWEVCKKLRIKVLLVQPDLKVKSLDWKDLRLYQISVKKSSRRG